MHLASPASGAVVRSNLKNLQKKILIHEAKIQAVVRSVFRKLKKRGHFKVSPFWLSIVFVGTRRMRTINKKYLGHDYVTDVFDL